MTKRLLGLVLVVGAIGIGLAATAHATASRKWALIKYDYPVKVGDVILFGNCVVEHDDAKMARGEPCTSIYSIAPDGHRRLLVSFHCVPAERKPVKEFTTVVRHVPELGTTLTRMVEYQFAGETEAHAVPTTVTATH